MPTAQRHQQRQQAPRTYTHWQASLRDVLNHYNNVAARSGKAVS